MSDIIGNAQILLSANTARFEQDLVRAKKVAGESFSNIKDSFADMSTELAYGATAIVGGFALMMKSQMDYASEMENFSKTAGVSVQKMQELSASAKILGMDTDDLNDIYDDLNQKMGEFTSKGDSELKDLFEQLPKAVNLTAESFRNLSGPEAMQKYYDALEKSNMTEREKVYWMEQFAGESSKLIPFLRNHGALQKEVNEAMEKSGAIMDEKTLKATRELKAGTQLLDMSFQGVKNQLTQGLLPVFADMAGSMVKDTQLKDTAKKAGDGLAVGFKYIVATGIGVIGIFQMMGTALGGFMAAVAQLGTVLDGVDFSSPFAFFQIGKNMLGVPEKVGQVLKDTWIDVKNIAVATDNALGEITQKWGTGESSGLAKKLAEANSFKAEAVKGKANVVNPDDKDDDDEDGEKKGKKSKVKPLTVNQVVLAHAEKYGYADLEKRYGLPAGLLSAVSMQESRGNPNATSGVGAKGEFQFMPATARRFGIEGQERNTAKASEASAKYLSYLLKMFGSQDLAIMAYNAGEGNIQKGRRPAETRDYLTKVSGYLAYMKGGADGSYGMNQVLSQDQQRIKEQESQLKELEKERLDFSGAKKDQIYKPFKDKFLEVANNPQATAEDKKKAEEFYHNQAKLAWQAYQNGIKEQVKNSGSFLQTEQDKILEEAKKKTDAVNANPDLNRSENSKAKEQILKNIDDEKQYRLAMLDLVHTKEDYNNQKEHMTTIDRIKVESYLKRQEISMNSQLDDETRFLRMQQVDEDRESALKASMQSFKDEIDQINGYEKSEKEKITDDFNKKRDVLDKRNDIDPWQKAQVFQALSGARAKALNDNENEARAGYDNMTGNSLQKNLLSADKEKQDRLKQLAKWRKDELITEKEHKKAMLDVERQYQLAKNNLILDEGEKTTGAMVSVLKNIAGENSKAYHAMFAIDKGFAIAKSMIAIQTTIASSAMSMPFPANLGAIATVATEMASIISNIQSVRMPAVQGQAHDGIDYIPREGTWLLDGGERIVKPADNRKLSDFLDSQDGQNGNKNPVNVNIHNHAGVPVTQKRDSNGDLRLIIGDELARQLPHHVNNPSSDFNQSMKRNYHIQRRFG